MAEIRLTAEELFNLHDSLCSKAKETMKAKNRDYSTGHNGQDVFANFRNSPAYADVEPEQGILLRIGDKIARVKTWLKAGTLLVKDEGLDNVFQDMINYTILLAGMIEEKKKNQPVKSEISQEPTYVEKTVRCIVAGNPLLINQALYTAEVSKTTAVISGLESGVVHSFPIGWFVQV